MVNAGLSEVIGSWKIIEILSPRSSRIAEGDSRRRSTPSNRMLPPPIRPGGVRDQAHDRQRGDALPQPDSPTMPSVRPASSEKPTPSTAANSPPASTANSVRKSRTSSSAAHRCRARCLETFDFGFDRGAIGDASGARRARQAGEERLIALEAHLVQAFQFGDRVRVIVDAEVEKRIDLGRVDQQRRGLLAALVAACRLARRHRGQQSLGERSARVRLVGPRGLRRAPAGPASILPATENPSCARSPHQSMHSAPVWAAQRPRRSIRWSWRCSRPSSPATRRAYDIGRGNAPLEQVESATDRNRD